MLRIRNLLAPCWLALAAVTVFGVLVAMYIICPNRSYTVRHLDEIMPTTTNDNMLSSLNVTSIAQDCRSLMWIGTSAGINVYDGQGYVQFSHNTHDPAALPDDYINCLHRDRKGRMWVGTQNGVARYEGAGRFRRFALPGDYCNVVRIADAVVGDGVAVETSAHVPHRYFMIDDNGVRECSATNFNHMAKVQVPGSPYCLRKPEQIVSCAFADDLGNTWVGFRNAGYQVVSACLTDFKRANDNVLAATTRGKDIIAVERVGRCLLAGTTLRLYVCDNASGCIGETLYKSVFTNIDGVRPELNNIVHMGDNGRVWLVGNREVVACQVRGIRLVTGNRWLGGPKGEVQLGCGTRMGQRLFVSCDDGSIMSVGTEAGDVEHIKVDSKWFDNETQLVALRSGGLLLFMRNMHMAVYTPSTGRVTQLEVKGADVEGNVDPAFAREDSYGNVWLGTKRSGLFCLDMNRDSVRRMGFINDVHIQALAEDGRRNLWITTLKDVVCYNPSTREVLLNSLVSSSQDGSQRQFFDNSICLSSDGMVVLGSSDGCYFVQSDMAPAHRQRLGRLCVYAIGVTTTGGQRLAVNDSIADGAHYTFAHNENTLSFAFFYPNYGASSSLMYQYMLEGRDNGWREATYYHTAAYDNLPPGRYTFRLRLVASPNMDAVCERSVAVTIRPAWWMSWAAWMFYAACVVALVYYVNSLYLRLRTNRMRLLNERHEREREQRANEMNMSFFANISHEFRNPITLIAGPLIALRSDSSLTEAARRSLSRVCLSVNRMLRLIDQMLDFNQLETDALRLRVAQADAAVEMERLACSFEEPARVRGIEFVVEGLRPDCFVMWLDTDKFEKIMSNLFTNALKHTPDNGRIAITMSVVPTPYQGQWLRVEVFNSGSHIADERMDDVFKRYFQLADANASHKYGWGTGIGLYYVKRLVMLHHGEIGVRNQYDVTDARRDGVVFDFSLPMSQSAYAPMELTVEPEHVMQISVEPVDIADEQQADSGRPKILIVDDDVDVAQYMRSLFMPDYVVENRYSAEAALRDMADIKPDIVLSDIIMGEMSGFDFCRTLKADLMWSHIPVVLVTAKSDIGEQISGLRLGAVAYVTKPFDPSYVRALVESQLKNMQTLRQRLAGSTRTDQVADIATSMSDNDRHFMDELYAVMERRLAEFDLSVAVVSHDLLISQSKFNYKLKQLTGDTPGAFFRKYKLNCAARLLREGGHNVSEVAVMTGFGTAAHFSVAFKKQFGMAPSEYV